MFSHRSLFRSPLFDSPFGNDPFFRSSAQPTQQSINNHKKDVEEEKYPEPSSTHKTQVPVEATIKPVNKMSSKESNNETSQSTMNETPSTTQAVAHRHRSYDPYHSFLSPFDTDFTDGIFSGYDEFPLTHRYGGFPSFAPLQSSIRRMERIMDQFEPFVTNQYRQMTHNLPLNTDAPVSYSSSSTYTSTQSGDGSAPMVVQSHREARSIGGVTEEKSKWMDSFGNERSIERRRLGEKTHEVIEEKNAEGQQRSHENLHQIEPQQVEEFKKEWQNKFNWNTSTPQRTIKDNSTTPQPTLTAAPNSTSTAAAAPAN